MKPLKPGTRILYMAGTDGPPELIPDRIYKGMISEAFDDKYTLVIEDGVELRETQVRHVDVGLEPGQFIPEPTFDQIEEIRYRARRIDEVYVELLASCTQAAMRQPHTPEGQAKIATEMAHRMLNEWDKRMHVHPWWHEGQSPAELYERLMGSPIDFI